MAIVDQGAMYRAGLSRGSAGTNPQVEARIRRQQNLTQIGLGIVGAITEEGIKYGVEQLKNFKAKKKSQTAARNLSASKIPEGNPYLENDLLKIHDNIKNAKRAFRNAGTDEDKKAAQALVRRYEKALTNFNADLTTMQSWVPQAQGTLGVEAGTAGQDNKGGSKNISPAATTDGFINLAEQGNGRMGKLMFWDHDNDVMRVIRGGRWVEREDGTESYENLGIEQNKELKKKYEKYVKGFEEASPTTQLPGEGLSVVGGQYSFSPPNAPTAAGVYGDTETYETSGTEAMSYADWAQEENRNTLRTPTYSEVNFAKEEDRKMMDEYSAFKDEIYNAGYTDDQAKAKRVLNGKTKGEVFQKIDGYKEEVFKDFFFGGPGYNYSDRRATNESLAHLLLMNRGLIPPGSENSTEKSNTEWEGGLTGLKFQDMGPGTPYRQIAQEYLWSQLESNFNAGAEDYATDNAEDPNTDDGRKEETYVTTSRQDSQALEGALKTFDMNDLQNLKITKGYEVVEDEGKIIVRRLYDGMNMTPEGLDPNDRKKARNILYRYMPSIRTEHRQKGEVEIDTEGASKFGGKWYNKKGELLTNFNPPKESTAKELDWESMSMEEILSVIKEDK